jgi:hypothetical protein
MREEYGGNVALGNRWAEHLSSSMPILIASRSLAPTQILIDRPIDSSSPHQQQQQASDDGDGAASPPLIATLEALMRGGGRTHADDAAGGTTFSSYSSPSQARGQMRGNHRHPKTACFCNGHSYSSTTKNSYT